MMHRRHPQCAVTHTVMHVISCVAHVTGATAPDGGPRHYGWFRGDTPHVLGANVIWVLVIFGWTMGMMYPFFLILKKLGMLRISREEELVCCPPYLHVTHL